MLIARSLKKLNERKVKRNVDDERARKSHSQSVMNILKEYDMKLCQQF